MATKEGSFITMPSPRTYTSVLAVPRSMARSLEKNPAKRLISIQGHPGEKGGALPSEPTAHGEILPQGCRTAMTAPRLCQRPSGGIGYRARRPAARPQQPSPGASRRWLSTHLPVVRPLPFRREDRVCREDQDPVLIEDLPVALRRKSRHCLRDAFPDRVALDERGVQNHELRLVAGRTEVREVVEGLPVGHVG